MTGRRKSDSFPMTVASLNLGQTQLELSGFNLTNTNINSVPLFREWLLLPSGGGGYKCVAVLVCVL